MKVERDEESSETCVEGVEEKGKKGLFEKGKTHTHVASSF